MKSLRQIAFQAFLGFVCMAAVFWWLCTDEPETLEPEHSDVPLAARPADAGRPLVVGAASLTSMVRVGQSDGEEERDRPLPVHEKLRVLGEGVRAVPAPAGLSNAVVAATIPVRSPEAIRRREKPRDEPSPDGWQERMSSSTSLTETERKIELRQVVSEKSAFVPHEPRELPAERTRWQAALKGLGVDTWSYRAIRISEHSYRVNAFFVLADGRSFVFSTITQNGYPAAPVLVQEWLAKNPPEEA